jgi:hypothetical protein
MMSVISKLLNLRISYLNKRKSIGTLRKELMKSWFSKRKSQINGRPSIREHVNILRKL